MEAVKKEPEVKVVSLEEFVKMGGRKLSAAEVEELKHKGCESCRKDREAGRPPHIPQILMVDMSKAHAGCAQCKETMCKLQRCTNCRSIYYCSKDCQKAHWPLHKATCLLTAKNGASKKSGTKECQESLTFFDIYKTEFNAVFKTVREDKAEKKGLVLAFKKQDFEMAKRYGARSCTSDFNVFYMPYGQAIALYGNTPEFAQRLNDNQGIVGSVNVLIIDRGNAIIRRLLLT